MHPRQNFVLGALWPATDQSLDDIIMHKRCVCQVLFIHFILRQMGQDWYASSPCEVFLHFLAKLQVQANSVREMPHKGLPVYKANTRKVSYKIYQIEKLQNALDEQSLVQLNTNILYAGQTQLTEEANPGTADEEIARAKQRAYQPRQQRRPSSKSVLVVGRGEGRSTREVEVICWPDLYALTNHGQMTLRLFIEKCEF